jgi:hypothetical protein
VQQRDCQQSLVIWVLNLPYAIFYSIFYSLFVCLILRSDAISSDAGTLSQECVPQLPGRVCAIKLSVSALRSAATFSLQCSQSTFTFATRNPALPVRSIRSFCCYLFCELSLGHLWKAVTSIIRILLLLQAHSVHSSPAPASNPHTITNTNPR